MPAKLFFPEIWGHRGCRGPGNPPENTLAAFREAVVQGANGVEFDVMRTADHQVVVFHDEKLDKLTNGRGRLKAHTLAELKKLRVMGSDEQIPTLQEVLAALNSDDRFILNIEIKDVDAAQGTAEILKAALKLGYIPENFIVSSFARNILASIAAMMPGIRISALYDRDEQIEALPFIPYSMHFQLERLDEALVAEIRGAGSRPVAWTSREKLPEKNKEIWRIREFDLPIITDYPREMRLALGKLPGGVT